MSASAQGQCPNAGKLCNCTGACHPLPRRIPDLPNPPLTPVPASVVQRWPCGRGVQFGQRGLHHFEANEHGVVCRYCGESPK